MKLLFLLTAFGLSTCSNQIAFDCIRTLIEMRNMSHMVDVIVDKKVSVGSIIRLCGCSNSQVKVFLVTTHSIVGIKHSTFYLPTKICSRFTSLDTFDISANLLMEISRSNFEQCLQVKNVKIINSAISWLPEDVFNDLVELATLDLNSNKLVFLPTNLFSENQKLQSVDLSSNKITLIHMTLPVTVTKLLLSDNACIDKKAENESEMPALVSTYQKTCRDSGIEKDKADLKDTIDGMEKDKADLQHFASILQYTTIFLVVLNLLAWLTLVFYQRKQ